jgi:hypothetical protein
VFKVEAEGRQKVEDCRYNYSVDEENKTFSALGWELFPWSILGLIFMSREVLDAFSVTLRASLGFAQSKVLRRPWVPRFVKVLSKHCLEKRLVRPCQS